MTTRPTTRVLTALELLQSRSRMSGAELADRLSVDRRTVRRYITVLQDLGVPIESETGRFGGYRLRPGYKLPPMMFTEEETLALTLGLLVVRRLGMTEAAPAVEGALAKVDRVLPDALRGRVHALQGALAFTPMRGTASPSDPATLVALSTAAQQNRRVYIRYRSGDDVTERTIDPYGIVHHQGRWYAVGWCHLREDVRMFRLDRILALDARADRGTFVRSLDLEPAEYVLHSMATLPWGQPVEVLLELSLDEARRRFAPDVGTFEVVHSGVRLRAKADDLRWMARQLIYAGCEFCVVHPPELRDELRRLSIQIGRIARRGVRGRQSSTKTESPGRTVAASPSKVA
jgi:predicted DNA-binding transcriptional regulator YafY